MTGAVAAAPAADAASKRRLPHRAPTGARRCFSSASRAARRGKPRRGAGSDVEAEADDVAVPDFVVAAFLAQGAGGLRARFAA